MCMKFVLLDECDFVYDFYCKYVFMIVRFKLWVRLNIFFFFKIKLC